MYLITTHVPIYLDGDRRFATTDWLRSLMLLRNALGGRLGGITILAPWQPVSDCEQVLQELDGTQEIDVVPSFDRRCRARHFWLSHRRRWIADIRRLLPQAEVVHAGFDDLYRPILYTGHLEAVRAGKATIFSHDIDRVLAWQQRMHEQPWRERLRKRLYLVGYNRCMRYGVRTADLSLLKGGTLYRRWAQVARNAKAYHDTSYLTTEIVAQQKVDRRLAGAMARRPLRLVYCGRLVEYKGVDHSIRIIEAAFRQGADVVLDVIGHGPQASSLQRQVEETGMQHHVRFLGQMRYGPELLARLATYDMLMYTPRCEDTPRVIFDAYACGLPLFAYATAYVQDRVDEDHAAVAVPRDDVAAGAAELVRLSRDRGRLAGVTQGALRAARFHAADNWFRKRAEWTIEAVQRHGAESGIPASA